MWQEKFREQIIKKFTQLKGRNPRYSIRAFAKKLEISPGALSQIMNAKAEWSLSTDRAATIAVKLELEPRSLHHLLTIMGIDSNPMSIAMNDEEHRLLLDWTYYSILLCLDLKPELSNINSIGKKFGLSTEQVEKVIQDQIKRGYVKEINGKFKTQSATLSSSDGPPNHVIREYHKINLNMALQSIEKVSPELRQISSIRFTTKKENLELVRIEIKKFYEKMLALTATDDADEAYTLGVNFFPISFTSEGK